MPTNDALELINWIPQQYGVRCRKGYREWATGLTKPVRTVFAYNPSRTDILHQKLFAATDDGVYDITAAGANPSVSLPLSGVDNAGHLRTVMFANAAGTFILATSATDGYKYYNGTDWFLPAAGTGPGSIDGPDPAKLNYVTLWKRRSWFIERGTTKVWYSATDALVGTFQPLDLGAQLPHGGTIAFIANWTIDAGEGVDDYIVFGGENGDILIYKGTDPASVTSFAISGRWYVGPLPIGQRVVEQMGGDLLVLSQTGLQPLSYVTRGGQSLLRASSVDYLAKIQPLLSEQIAASLNQTGWDITMVLQENLLIIQKPTAGTSVYEQIVLYINTPAWCRFVGMPMICAYASQSGFYFGTDDGRVCLGLTGYFDNVPLDSTVGDGIQGTIQPAYSYFGVPGANKQFHMVRPSFLANSKPSVGATMVADYRNDQLGSANSYAGVVAALWDVGLWDQSVWAGNKNTYNDWFSAAAVGYTGSIVLQTTCTGDTFLASIDYTFEMGDSL